MMVGMVLLVWWILFISMGGDAEGTKGKRGR